MTRKRSLLPLTLDPATVKNILVRLCVDTLAVHHPGPDGLCPECGERLCAIRLGAVRAVRAAGIKVAVLPPHPPRRPQWECEFCDCPWPCSQARVMLGDEYEANRVGLAVRMAELRRQAREELPYATDTELYARFVGWV